MNEMISTEERRNFFSGQSHRYDRIGRTAEELVGHKSTPYLGSDAGVSTKNGFDCSGFVKYVLTECGIEVPDHIRHSNEFFDFFGILIHSGLQRRGDLIFFSHDGGVRPTHMGIVTSSMEYVHAPGKIGTQVSVAKINERPILRLSDHQKYLVNPIGIKRPMVTNGRWQMELA
jgi:cell wall-associated NlpC family hydrolase